MYTIGNDISQFTYFGKYYKLSMSFRIWNFKDSKILAQNQNDKRKSLYLINGYGYLVNVV